MLGKHCRQIQLGDHSEHALSALLGSALVRPFGVLLCLALLVRLDWDFAAFGCGWHYNYQEGDKIYVAVEADRLVRLIQVYVHATGNPFYPGSSVLVEPCSAAEHKRTDLACWPAAEQLRTQELLRVLATEFPQRRTGGFLHAAEYLNRDLGAFHPAWVIGLDPVAVAYREGTGDPEPYADLARRGVATRPTTTPGVIELVSRSGETTSYDRRARKAQLVTEADLDAVADVVLVFPDDMQLPWGQLPAASATRKLKVYYLEQPKPLRWLMDALRQKTLDREVKDVIERPVTER